jgi:hypothetical protein
MISLPSPMTGWDCKEETGIVNFKPNGSVTELHASREGYLL